MNVVLYFVMIAGFAVVASGQGSDKLCENIVRAVRSGVQERNIMNAKFVIRKVCNPSDEIENKMKERLAAAYDNDPGMFSPYATSRIHYVQMALPEMMKRYASVDHISVDVRYDGVRGEMWYEQKSGGSEGGELVVSEYARWERGGNDGREYRALIVDRLLGLTNNVVSRNEAREEYRWYGRLNPDDLGRIRLIVTHLEKERGVMGDVDLARLICAEGLRTRFGKMSVGSVEYEGKALREINAKAFVGPSLVLVCDEDLKVYSRRLYAEPGGRLIRCESFSYNDPSSLGEYPSNITVVLYDDSSGEEKCRTIIEKIEPGSSGSDRPGQT
jgi:hypothetical protein